VVSRRWLHAEAAEDQGTGDVLARLSVPVLVTHGRADAIILPSMADRTLEVCQTAVPSWYEGVGHLPFVEDAERFNRELAAFTENARDRVSS
jgi:non-heme chloroperoxidase